MCISVQKYAVFYLICMHKTTVFCRFSSVLFARVSLYAYVGVLNVQSLLDENDYNFSLEVDYILTDSKCRVYLSVKSLNSVVLQQLLSSSSVSAFSTSSSLPTYHPFCNVLIPICPSLRHTHRFLCLLREFFSYTTIFSSIVLDILHFFILILFPILLEIVIVINNIAKLDYHEVE